MIRIYAEAPFVLQLALRQEFRGFCAQLLDLASANTIELAVPLVALLEPLWTVRQRAAKQNELTNSWRAEARQFARTNEGSYQDAARALQEAILKTAAMADDERRSLNTVIAQIGTGARVLVPTIEQFAVAYMFEAKGLTPLDALALTCIVEDARKLDASAVRALLALDGKAISSLVAEDVKSAGLKIFLSPEKLAAWLATMGIEIVLPSREALIAPL